MYTTRRIETYELAGLLIDRSGLERLGLYCGRGCVCRAEFASARLIVGLRPVGVIGPMGRVRALLVSIAGPLNKDCGSVVLFAADLDLPKSI